MDYRLRKLINQAGALGLCIDTTTDLPQNMRGLYVPEHRTIWLRDRLSDTQKLCTLQHELIHVERGDNGAQASRIEAKIDEEAARRLISHTEYMLAEQMYGENRYVLARELDVTPAIIEAYQRALTLNR